MLGKKKIEKKSHSNSFQQKSKPESSPENPQKESVQTSLAQTPPTTKLGFEKQLLTAPNDSEIWIQFVSFTLENDSVEAARKLIERALVVVNFTQYADKENLWKCLVNMEFSFGDADSLKNALNRSTNACDAQIMINHVLSLFVQSNKFIEGEDLLKLLLKKGKSKIDSWLKNVEYYLSWDMAMKGNSGQMDLPAKIKDTNKRALQSLDKREHIAYLNRYAVLEYKWGGFLNGRTQFENILANFPKRADVWVVYLDMEMKYAKEEEYTRSLFEKAISVSLKSKSIKLIFKKYLEFEKNSGKAGGEKYVKKRATEFVKNLMAKKGLGIDADSDEEDN